jgi:hypothetical protein
MGMRLIGSVNASDKVWGIQQYIAAINQGKKYGAGLALHEDLNRREEDYDVVIAPKDYLNGAALFDRQTGVAANIIWGYIRKSKNLEGILTESGKNSATPRLERPLIFWNPKMDVVMIGDHNGITDDALNVVPVKKENAGKGMFVRTKLVGKNFITKRVIIYTRTILPAWLVLYHELGHIRQSFEKGGDASFLIYSQDTAAMESDNLARVEHPLCEQARIPKRASYMHLEMAIPLSGNLQQAALNAHKADFPIVYVAQNQQERERIDRELQSEASANVGKDPSKTVGLFYNVL